MVIQNDENMEKLADTIVDGINKEHLADWAKGMLSTYYCTSEGQPQFEFDWNIYMKDSKE